MIACAFEFPSAALSLSGDPQSLREDGAPGEEQGDSTGSHILPSCYFFDCAQLCPCHYACVALHLQQRNRILLSLLAPRSASPAVSAAPAAPAARPAVSNPYAQAAKAAANPYAALSAPRAGGVRTSVTKS